jgi:hypothetical protein
MQQNVQNKQNYQYFFFILDRVIIPIAAFWVT